MKHIPITIAAVVLVGCGSSVDIWEATKEGDIEVVKQHLAAGTDVDAKDDKFGLTPLRMAAANNQNEIAKLLIKEGANVNIKDEDAYTPIHYASVNGHVDIVELLLVNNANVNIHPENVYTSLHGAASGGHFDVLKLIINKGANLNSRDHTGDTPLDLATHPENRNASSKTADLLHKHGGKTGEELKTEGK